VFRTSFQGYGLIRIFFVYQRMTALPTSKMDSIPRQNEGG
jgi:hypothetical protein